MIQKKHQKWVAVICLGVIASLAYLSQTMMISQVPFYEGWESGTISSDWSQKIGATSSLSVDSSVVHSGSYALAINCVAGESTGVYIKTATNLPHASVRIYYYFAPTASGTYYNTKLLDLGQNDWTSICYVSLQGSRESCTLSLNIRTNMASVSQQINLQEGTWHYLELEVDIPTYSYYLYWDTTTPTLSILNTPPSTSVNGIGGFDFLLSERITAYTDDIAISDSLVGPIETPPTYRTLTVLSSTGGTTTPTQGQYQHIEGTIVTITATPSTNYEFSNWLVNAIEVTSNPMQLAMDNDYSVRAIFTLLETTNYTLVIDPPLHGTTFPIPGSYSYPSGSNINVYAIPDLGYALDYWTLDGESVTINPIIIEMNADHTLSAQYVASVSPIVDLPISISIVSLLIASAAAVIFYKYRRKGR